MRKCLLLIDDDEDEHELFTHHLLDFDPNIKIRCAFSGKQALKLLAKFNPDCIFLDVNMPGNNGLEVLKEIKNIKAAKQIPVFIFSTSAGHGIKPQALE